jgi:hypothetical protein
VVVVVVVVPVAAAVGEAARDAGKVADLHGIPRHRTTPIPARLRPTTTSPSSL